MSLKRKIVLYVNLIMIITLIIIFLSTDNVMEDATKEVLNEYKGYRMKVLDNFLKESSQELENIIYDNAYWDDLYYNLEKTNIKWLKETVTQYIYEEQKFNIDILLLEKEDGSYVELYGNDISVDDLKSTNVYRKTYSDLILRKKAKINKEYAIIDNIVYEIVASPVTTNNIAYMNGILLLGRAIDDEFLLSLSNYLILDYEEISLVKNKSNSSIKNNSNDFVNIYFPIKDANENNLTWIKVVYDISTFDDIKYFAFKKVMTSILLFSFISVLIGLYFVNKYIKKIEGIITQINLISSGDYSNKLEEKGAEEIVKLLKSVNKLSEEIEKRMREQEQSYMESIKTLVTSIEVKDTYTKGHSERVSFYASKLGAAVGYEEISILVDSGLVHDIGKIAIPDYILNKPGKLTEKEYEIIKKHPEIGYKILDTSNMFEKIKHIIKYHHERYDGSGYPDCLSGEDIPLGSRILAIADAFDALTSDRAYRQALSVEEAVKIIIKESGYQFDPYLVNIFRNNIHNIYGKLSDNEILTNSKVL